MRCAKTGKKSKRTIRRSNCNGLHAQSHASHSLSLFLLFLSILGGMGALVYGLYSIVMKNRSVYGHVFYAAFGGLVLFYVLKAVRNGTFVRVLLKIFVVLIKMFLVLFSITGVMLYGAFVVRHLVIGACITPVVAVLVIVALQKFRIGFFVKKYFNNLRHRY
jgi:hypothetical protein